MMEEDEGKYKFSQRKMKENISSLQKKTGDLVTQDIEKAEVLNDFFAQSSLVNSPGTRPKSQKGE